MYIGVLLGGISNEREISILSGKSVAAALRRKGHVVDELYVQEDFKEKVSLYKRYDALFNALHGYFGEDGQIQKILQENDIPYTGCGIEASKILMDKIKTKRIVEKNGILTPDWFTLSAWKKNTRKIPAGFVFPLVVKPSDNGSSVNISIVRERRDFEEAVKSVLATSKTTLIEKYISGRELTVGILGTTVLPIIELKPQREFYDYTAKYLDNDTQYLCPAPVSGMVRKNVKSIVTSAFEVLGCRDLVRFDMILGADEKVYFLEGNSIPGFTDHSLVPKAAEVAGIAFEDVCEMLIEIALKRSKQADCV